jgi:hypothetical protein
MYHSLRPLELYGKCLLHAVVFEISHSSMEHNTSNDLMSLFQVDSGCRHGIRWKPSCVGSVYASGFQNKNSPVYCIL